MTRHPYDKSDDVEMAFWCFVGILIALGVALVREGVLQLWPLIEQWL